MSCSSPLTVADKLCHRAAWTLYYQRGAPEKEEEASALVREGLEHQPTHVRLLTLHARLECLRGGNYRAAFRAVQQALLHSHSSPLPSFFPASREEKSPRGATITAGCNDDDDDDKVRQWWCGAVVPPFVQQHDTDSPSLSTPEDREFGAFKNVVYVLERCPPNLFSCSGEGRGAAPHSDNNNNVDHDHEKNRDDAAAFASPSMPPSAPHPFTLLKALYQSRYAKMSTVARGEEYLLACVRVGDYKTAQQLSNALARQSNAKKHRMWGIEALLGQLPPPPPLCTLVPETSFTNYHNNNNNNNNSLEDSSAPPVLPTSSLQLQIASKMLDKLLPTAAQVTAVQAQEESHQLSRTAAPVQTARGNMEEVNAAAATTTTHADPHTLASESSGDQKKKRKNNHNKKRADTITTTATTTTNNNNDNVNHSNSIASAASAAVSDWEEEGANRVSTPAMAQAFLDVLRQQGAYREAVEFLCSWRGGLIGFPDRRLEVLGRTLLTFSLTPSASLSSTAAAVANNNNNNNVDKQTAARLANVIGRELWFRQPDHWSAFELYVAGLQQVRMLSTESTQTLCSAAAAAAEAGNQDEGEKSIGIPKSLDVSGVGARLSAHRVPPPPFTSSTSSLPPSSSSFTATMISTFNAAEADETWEQALALAAHMQSREKVYHPSSPRRGPFLAQLRLLQLQIKEETQEQQGEGDRSVAGSSSVSGLLEDAVVAYAKQFFRLPCCYLDLSTFLTCRSAGRIYQWATLSATATAAACKDGEEDNNNKNNNNNNNNNDNNPLNDGSGESLDEHTRYILGLRCYIAMWHLTEEKDNNNSNNNNNNNNSGEKSQISSRHSSGDGHLFSMTFSPTMIDMQYLVRSVCVPRFRASSERLSSHLPWSEEGLTDGYLLCAANIALYAIAFYPPAQHTHGCGRRHPEEEEDADGRGRTLLVAEVLRALQEAPRGDNNPAFLLFRAAFAGYLRVFDSTAVQKLALLSVQHDTMSHVGFWASLPGLPLSTTGTVSSGGAGGEAHHGGGDAGTLQSWCAGAEQYYRLLLKDCGDARVKVVQNFNWPVMQSIERFRERQLHSVNRLLHVAHRTLTELLSCQTKQNVMEVCGRRRGGLLQSWEELCIQHDLPPPPPPPAAAAAAAKHHHPHHHTGEDEEVGQGHKEDSPSKSALTPPPEPLPHCRRSEEILPTLVDNTDWLVVHSTLLAPVQSGKARQLCQCLFPHMPTSLQDHLYKSAWGLPLLHSLLLLCDMARVNEWEDTKKKRKLTPATASLCTSLRGGAGGRSSQAAKQQQHTSSKANSSPKSAVAAAAAAGGVKEASGLESTQDQRYLRRLIEDLFVSPPLRAVAAPLNNNNNNNNNTTPSSASSLHPTHTAISFLPILEQTGIAAALIAWLQRGRQTVAEATAAMKKAGFTQTTQLTDAEVETYFGFSARKANEAPSPTAPISLERQQQQQPSSSSDDSSWSSSSVERLREFLNQYVPTHPSVAGGSSSSSCMSAAAAGGGAGLEVGTAALFESLLLPSAMVFLTLLHVCKAFRSSGTNVDTVLPVREWAILFAEAMETARSHYQSGLWASSSLLSNTNTQEDEVTSRTMGEGGNGGDDRGARALDGGGSSTGKKTTGDHSMLSRLRAEKHNRLISYLDDIIVDSRAISRF